MRYVILLTLILNLFASPVLADIQFENGIWRSTFDCAEQEISGIGTNICDGLDVEDFYDGVYPYRTQITTSANNPDGAGGRGYLHWMADERNVHSDVLTARFAPTKRLWIRWYSKWEAGMGWTNQRASKMMYLQSSAGIWFYFMIPYTDGTNHDTDTTGWLLNGYSDDYDNLRNSDTGWYTAQGNSVVADGNWDFYEIYMEINDSPGVANGIFRTWINGQLVHTVSNYDFLQHASSGDGYITGVDILANHDIADPPGAATITSEYLDDLAIAKEDFTGFVTDSYGNPMIGPVTDGQDPETCSTDPTLCATEPDCTTAGWNWCDGVCQVAACPSPTTGRGLMIKAGQTTVSPGQTTITVQ